MDVELQSDAVTSVGEGLDERRKHRPSRYKQGAQMNVLSNSLFWTALMTWAAISSALNDFAQNSSSWADVVSWQATYSLTGTGAGTTTDGTFVYTWTVNRQFTAGGVLTN